MSYCLALDMIKKTYDNNSLILSLGESPCKLVFAQSLFYNNITTKQLISDYKNIPEIIEFQYLPLSNVRHYGKPLTTAKNIMGHNGEAIYSCMGVSNDILDIYLQHFMNHKLDPKSIIENKMDKFITVDRVESYKSICSYIFIYFSMAIKQNLSDEQKIILINKFKIVGFNGSYEDDPQVIIKCNRHTREFIAIVLEKILGIEK